MAADKKRMTFREAQAQYPDEWVVFSETNVDEQQELIDGVLYFHSKDHDLALEKSEEIEGDATIDFTGTRHYERLIRHSNAKNKSSNRAA